MSGACHRLDSCTYYYDKTLTTRGRVPVTRYGELLAMAVMALCIGVLVYAFDRQANHVYFLPAWLSAYNGHGGLFGLLGNYLPTFIHVYVFILLTVVVAGLSESRVLLACFSWFAIDSLFEIAQLEPIARWLAGHVPTWFNGIPFLENTSSYFLHGTFDVLDLLSIAAGTLAARLTCQLLPKGTEK